MNAVRAIARMTAPQRQAVGERRHRRFVENVLGKRSLVEAIANNAILPSGYGRGYSERCIEWPWAVSRVQPGALLDAGGTFNHAFLLKEIPSSVAPISIMSVSHEPALPDPRVDYQRADLREIPVADESYDTVACLSTLEHVGMDISRYTPGVAPSPVPQTEAVKAIDELWRVLRPGGRLLITCPVGAPQRFGSARHLSEADVADILSHTEGLSTTHLFAYAATGWQPSGWKAVENLRYRDRSVEPVARDRAPAARAVVCIEVRRP